jgi:DNA-directed RNA polymerase specialized sigma54-like protein
MALSQAQIQALQQKLSPQQIQFIKLLQMNTLDFESRLTEELLEMRPEELLERVGYYNENN